MDDDRLLAEYCRANGMYLKKAMLAKGMEIGPERFRAAIAATDSLWERFRIAAILQERGIPIPYVDEKTPDNSSDNGGPKIESPGAD